MADSRFLRFHMADLVMAALLCGLALALFTGGQTAGDAAIMSVLIGALVATWVLFHQRRKAPTCEECGRRFVAPRKPVLPAQCPHCGHEQLALRRSTRRLTKVFWSLVGVLVLLVAAVAVQVMGVYGGSFGTSNAFGVMIVSVCCELTVVALLGVGIYRSSLVRPRERPCEACGSVIAVSSPGGPKVCPMCRRRHLRPEVAKTEQAKNFGILFAFLGILSLLGAFVLSSFGAFSFVTSPWIRFPLLALAVFLAGLAGLVLIVFLILMRTRWRLRSERGVLAIARKATGGEGEFVRDGALSIWYLGPADPVPTLREQMHVARRHFETLLGEKNVTEPSLLALVFQDRGSFLRLHGRILPGVDLANFDGFFQGHPLAFFTVCTGPAPCRITDPRSTIRSLTAYALLESAWGPGPPLWLQQGLSRAVANREEQDRLTRLNRKMVASLSRGTELSAELFTFSMKDLSRLMRGLAIEGRFQKLRLFLNQSWSVTEYLWGEQSPGDERTPLGAFLRDPRSKTNQEEAFRLHFGLGFGPVLEGWRQWVLDQGIGTYEPPPDPIRDGLLERVLPVIRDRRAKRGDRIAAIREWGNVGYVLGAYTLIDMLRESDDLPREEIAWALGMVSGMEWHEDPDRWQAWWEDLPLACREPSEAMPRPSEGLLLTPKSVTSEVTIAPGPAHDGIEDGRREPPPLTLHDGT